MPVAIPASPTPQTTTALVAINAILVMTVNFMVKLLMTRSPSAGRESTRGGSGAVIFEWT